MSVSVNPGNIHTPAANTACKVTFPAGGKGYCHCISGIALSYNGLPVGGRLTIEDGAGNIIFDVDIIVAGLTQIVFPQCQKGSDNKAFIVTMTAGGSAVVGKLNILNHWTESA